MKKLPIIFACIFIFAVALNGCGAGGNMHQTKDKTPGGLPRQAPQVTADTRGNSVIELTPDLLYPGSAPYEGAPYDYISADNPQKVGDWFAANLKGSISNKTTTSDPNNFRIQINYKDLIIDILPGPNGGDTLIRYKTPLKTKTTEPEQKKK
jgi:hypothetical protein